MDNLSGYEETRVKVRERIKNELAILPPIFSEYIEYLRQQSRTETTVLAYLRALTVALRATCSGAFLFENSFYENIDARDIGRYFEEKTGVEVKGMQSQWTALNSFWTFLIEKKHIKYNPMDDIGRPVDSSNKRKISCLTKSEFDALLRTVKNNTSKLAALRDEVIIKLAVSTGLDITDLVNLNFENIDFRNGFLRVMNRKGERFIPLCKPMLWLLKAWGAYRAQWFGGDETPALFISQKRQRISTDTVGRMLCRYCEQANIPQITFKDLRSTMIYLLARENVSMESIMSLLDTSDYMVVVQAYDVAMKERNVTIGDAIENLFDDADSIENGGQAIQLEFSFFEWGNEL